jgi:amino acid adenylation domain-containing protein
VDQPQITALTAQQQRELLAKLLRQQSVRRKSFPMAAGQQGLWHAFRRNPQLTAFNVFLPTRIRDRFSPEVLQRSINLVASRHSALRTTFSDEGGQLVQIVHEQLDPTFSYCEMLGATEEAVRQRVILETLIPFDLTKGPLLRISVYKLADDDYVILALTHHIIVDFWSLVIILGELRQIFPALAAGRTPPIPVVTDNYHQFVNDQAQLLTSPAGDQLANFWREYLSGVAPVLELPLDKPRPTAFTHRAEGFPIHLSKEITPRILQLASQCRSTPFAVVHSAMQVLLQRYCRQEEFLVGSPFAGRLQQKYEHTVGFFINMLPVKATVRPEMTFAKLVQQTTQRLVDTMEHEAYPIANIVHLLGIARDASRSPLFQVSCTFERAQKQEELGRASFLFPDQKIVFDFGGLRQESFYIPHPTCHYDLEFIFEQSASSLQCMLIYCRDLFTVESIRHLVTNFASLLDNLLKQPHQTINRVCWGSAEQSASELRTDSASLDIANFTPTSSNSTVHQQIEEMALKHPAAIALLTETSALSYQQIYNRASSLSRALIEAGVQPEALVPVICRDSLQAFVGMLAVQLAGAAAVPIDVSQPSTDIAHVLKETRASCAVTDVASELAGPFSSLNLFEILAEPAQENSLDLDVTEATEVSPNNLAYMIYTSGSTGRPKGVLIEHHSICNTLNWRKRALPLTTNDKVLMLLSHQFDAALGIGWSCLTQGASIVFPSAATRRDPEQLLELIQRLKITVLPAVPSLLRVLASSGQFKNCTSLRLIWTGGEPIPVDLPELIRSQTSAALWNLYGPTEAAVEATAIDITDHSVNEKMTIGFPIDGVDVFAIDTNLQRLPIGVPGELAISGVGLARGYFDDTELTDKKFRIIPQAASDRIYLTGDIGRVLPDGRIDLMGREDHQVKLRGYRIELGEIESILEAYPQIDRAAVIVEAPGTAAAQLIAYVSPKAERQVHVEELRSSLTRDLPGYKLPAAIVVVEDMPLTSSGKVDRKKLPISAASQWRLDQVVPPRNKLEEFLVQAWCAELKLPSIGIHQNFFEIGGSSLQAALLTTQLSEQLQFNVPTAMLFDLADIAQLAERLVALHHQELAAQFGTEVVSFYESQKPGERPGLHPLLAPLKSTGSKPPLFMIHPPGGIVVCYRELARYLPEDQPLWAIRSRGLHGEEILPQTIEQMAADYLEAIRTVQARGPYILGGWSLGGLVAYEIARQMIDSGESCQRLVFLDTTIPEGATECVPANEQVNVGLEYGIQLTLDQLTALSPEEQLPLLHDHADKLGILAAQSPPEVVQRVLSDLQSLFHHHVDLSRRYRLRPLAPIELLLLRPTEVPFRLQVSEDRGWRHLVEKVDVRYVPGHHHSMVQTPHVKRLAEVLTQALEG